MVVPVIHAELPGTAWEEQPVEAADMGATRWWLARSGRLVLCRINVHGTIPTGAYVLGQVPAQFRSPVPIDITAPLIRGGTTINAGAARCSGEPVSVVLSAANPTNQSAMLVWIA